MDSRATKHHTIPESPTPIVGRERDLESLHQLFTDSSVRLLTLTGPGGVGKTRLALDLAHRLVDVFSDGVWWVDLAPLRDAGWVLSEIAATLHVQERGQQPLLATLTEALRDSDALVVLDNIEQVRDAAPQIAELIRWCSNLRILATGRSSFQLRAERQYPVEPLVVPNAADLLIAKRLSTASAMTLFADRVRAVDPSFALNDDNVRVVAEICRRLDGLPLAIELAATQAQVLEPAELLYRLERQLPLIGSGARDVPARHRTMEQTIAWSYDLLPPDAQDLFRRLAVCVGGFTLETAVAISQDEAGDAHDVDVLNGMNALVTQSLLRRADDRDGRARFAMLELTRAHALERLAASGEADIIRRRHALHFRSMVEEAETGLRGHESVAWMRRLETEHDNLRAALSWLLDAGETESAAGMAATLGRFWYARGHLSEGRAWLERVRDALGDGCGAERTAVLRALSTIVAAQGDTRYEAELADEALALSRRLGDDRSIAWSLHGRGNVAQRRGDLAEANDHYERALALFRRTDDQHGIVAAINNLGLVAAEQRDAERARRLLEDALERYRRHGNQQGTAIALCNLGQRVAELEGNRAAVGYFQEALPLFRSLGDMAGVAWGLQALADVATVEGDPRRAARLYGAAEAIRDAMGWTFPAPQRREYEGGVDALHERMDEENLRREWFAGRELTVEQAIAEASSVTVPAGGAGSSSPRGALPGRLSKREVEVLRLVATGLTSVQVAEELYLSPHTINAHLRRIYRKLGVTSRSAATRFAADHDLT